MGISVQPYKQFQRFTTTSTTVAFIVSALYLLLQYAIGWRSDHFWIVGIALVLYFANPISRRIFWILLFFLIYLILYDTIRVYPNHVANSVSIQELYDLEKSLFGIETINGVLTPNEFAAVNRHTILDMLSPIFYLTWVPVPILFALYLAFTDKSLAVQFAFTFMLANIIGIILYYVYPAAPPWYVAKHGFEYMPNMPGDPAGLTRFDEYFDISLFKNMYAKTANVFAAVPSMHCANPVVLVYFGIKKRLMAASILFFITLVGIWFAAVYTNHHYVIDVLLGGLTALSSIFLLEKVLLKTRFKHCLDNYTELL